MSMEEVDATSTIQLEPMAQRAYVWDEKDDWTGITSTKERRRLQNRLNQRAHRRRRAEERKEDRRSKVKGKGNEELPTEHQYDPIGAVYDVGDDGLRETSLTAAFETSSAFPSAHSISFQDYASPSTISASTASPLTSFSSPNSSDVLRPRVCNIPEPDMRALMNNYETQAYARYLLGSPRSDQLMTLIHFNVFRALLINTSSLGFDLTWLEEEAISPFNNPKWDSSGCLRLNDPALRGLRPTQLSHTIEHHPWIDLWPFPRMRDNALRALEAGWDDTTLCVDLVEFCCGGNTEMNGLIVWGDPHDGSQWEMTAGFVRKWGWLALGCKELWESTNAWRTKRGERKLPVPVVEEILEDGIGS